jgi:hypothetical protein
LRALAPKIPASLLPDAIAAAREASPELARVQALSALAARLPEPDRRDRLREALAIAISIDERKSLSHGHKWEALRSLAPLLVPYPPDETLAAVPQVSDRIVLAERMAAENPSQSPTIARALRHSLSHADGWRVELFLFSNAARDDLYALWKGTSNALAASTRENACSLLGRLRPVILALDGRSAVDETSRTVRDVARWWP